ncbi:uncharacterized protein LOC144091364 isoform X2 [Stigmatopora argus]
MDNGTTATRRLGLKLPLTFFMGFISSGEELFSLGGHSKSSPAISVMALRRCRLCPVMVTDDWLVRRGDVLTPCEWPKSPTSHTNACIRRHSTSSQHDCRKEIQEEGANLVWQTFNLSLQETISAAQISFSTGAKLIPPRKGCSTPEAPRRRGAAIELRLVEEKIVFVQKEQQSVIQLFQERHR